MDKNLGKSFQFQIAGRKASIEIDKICVASNGSCLVRCGDSVVLVNVCVSDKAREDVDFLPLSVDFEEKMYSVGKIPGGFKKREGRNDDAILLARKIDRPLRPLLDKNIRNDIVITATALSVDPDVSPEILAMIGSSFALTLTGISFDEPTGAIKIGCVDGKFVLNPTCEQQKNSSLDLLVSGTEKAVLMVEAGANEISEKEMLSAIMFGFEEIKNIARQIKEILASIEIKERFCEVFVWDNKLIKAIKDNFSEEIKLLFDCFDPIERKNKENQLIKKVGDSLKEEFSKDEKEIECYVEEVLKEFFKNRVMEKEIRPDGRGLNDIRNLWSEVGMLPRVHGSGIFSRGRTQVLTALTLGMIGSDAQKLENLEEQESKRFMHQYNMPPYSTGEARGLRAPNRREIGHGALAERALAPVIPQEEEFPYALRLVSEVLSSNGSSSMASVCASTLALMDGGVPIKEPVAGVAMGLVSNDNSYKILTDIQGLEDFWGEMDLKIAGTKNGITAIQMDLKRKGIDEKIFNEAFEKARIARLKILENIEKTISKPRTQLSKFAPKIISLKIKVETIKDVIGSGGKTINKIISDTGVKIDIEEDGMVFISGENDIAVNNAKAKILAIVEDVSVGKFYTGEVVRISTFGAFVEISPTKEGMIHISKLSSQRVEKVEDVVNIGDSVEVEVIGIDEKNRINLRLVSKN